MNPVEFALRRPITIMVALIALVAGGVLALSRMKVDIFPSLDLPVVYVAQPYGGLDPSQMEGLIANYYEYHFLYINGIHHVESKNVRGMSLIKLSFDPASVPVGYLVLPSDSKSVDEIQDQALFKVRPMFASIPGVSAPPPFGGNQRTVVVRADPRKLQGYNLSPDDVVRAVAEGNAISPSGNVRTPEAMPIVPVNSMV